LANSNRLIAGELPDLVRFEDLTPVAKSRDAHGDARRYARMLTKWDAESPLSVDPTRNGLWRRPTAPGSWLGPQTATAARNAGRTTL